MNVIPWVDLDAYDLIGFRVHCKLYVTPACELPNGVHHSLREVTHFLIHRIRQRHGRCDGNGITGMHTHRVEVLNATDDDDVP